MNIYKLRTYSIDDTEARLSWRVQKKDEIKLLAVSSSWFRCMSKMFPTILIPDKKVKCPKI